MKQKAITLKRYSSEIFTKIAISNFLKILDFAEKNKLYNDPYIFLDQVILEIKKHGKDATFYHYIPMAFIPSRFKWHNYNSPLATAVQNLLLQIGPKATIKLIEIVLDLKSQKIDDGEDFGEGFF